MNIILLSGGSGKRLWPLSNDVRSKQFLKIFTKDDGTRESMAQRMYRMIKEIDSDSTVTIATSENQIPQIRAQLGEEVGISVEPTRRDTFPAIALAAAYLKKNGINNRAKYNQVANYTYLDTHVNKAVGDKAPKEYFAIMCNQCDTHEVSIGNIKDIGELKDNLKDNAIPESVFTMEYGDFEEFLLQRRKLMAKFIENYYKGL